MVILTTVAVSTITNTGIIDYAIKGAQDYSEMQNEENIMLQSMQEAMENAIGGNEVENNDETKVTVTFNAQGGNVDNETKTIEKGSAIEDLPEPTKERYTFLGWYTEGEEGTEVSNETVINENTTIYAHWDGPYYTLTLVAGEGIRMVKLMGENISDTETISYSYKSGDNVDLTGYVNNAETDTSYWVYSPENASEAEAEEGNERWHPVFAYTFTNWKDNENNVISTTNRYRTYEMPSQDVILTATAQKSNTPNSTKANKQIYHETTYPDSPGGYLVDYTTNSNWTGMSSRFAKQFKSDMPYFTASYNSSTGKVTYTAKDGYYLRVHHYGVNNDTYTAIGPGETMEYYLNPTTVEGWSDA